MNIEEVKALSPYEQNVILLLCKIASTLEEIAKVGRE